MSNKKTVLLPGVIQMEPLKKGSPRESGKRTRFFNCLVKARDLKNICDKQVGVSHKSKRSDELPELMFLPGNELFWHPVNIRDFEEGSCISEINSFHEDTIGFLEVSPENTFSGDKNLFDFLISEYDDEEEILVSFI